MKPDVLTTALAECRRAFWSVALVSCATNLLMFAGPIYMLQVYDRVLTSRNVTTLVMLTVICVFLFLIYGALEALRTQVLVRAGLKFDGIIRDPARALSLAGAYTAPGFAFMGVT